MTVQFQHSPNLLTRKPIINNWTVSAWVCLSVFALDVNAMQTDHFMIHHFFQWPSHEWVQHHWCCAWKWESLVGIQISIAIPVDVDLQWFVLVCCLVLAYTRMQYSWREAVGVLGDGSPAYYDSNKKMGSHVRKTSFTLACTASVNPAFCWVETSPVADLRGPRKKLLRPASASIVRRGFGPWPQWQRECPFMFLSKDKETMSTKHKSKVTRWFDLTIFDYYSQLMWKCSAMMVYPVLGCGKVASFDG